MEAEPGEQSGSIQPLNFLLQWPSRFRGWGFGPTCPFCLFMSGLFSSCLQSHVFTLAAGHQCPSFPTTSLCTPAAPGLVWKPHGHLDPGPFCQSLVSEGAKRFLSSLPARNSRSWKTLMAEKRGLQWWMRVPPACSEAGLRGSSCSGEPSWCTWAPCQSMQRGGNV